MEQWIPFLRELPFPNLLRPFYRKTSDETDLNNCAAWAAGYASRWMQPKTESWHLWPDGAPNDYKAESFVRAFELVGFQKCADGSREDGYSKIAIFAKKDGEFGHAAKLMPDGLWSSKLGDWEDISHTTLDLLESESYGNVKWFMKRPEVPLPS